MENRGKRIQLRNAYHMVWHKRQEPKGTHTVFEEWDLLGNAFILLASLLALDRASGLTIESSVKVAEITGYAKTRVGFILVAFSTSLPEFSVSVFPAAQVGTIGVAFDVAMALVLSVLGIALSALSAEKAVEHAVSIASALRVSPPTTGLLVSLDVDVSGKLCLRSAEPKNTHREENSKRVWLK